MCCTHPWHLPEKTTTAWHCSHTREAAQRKANIRRKQIVLKEEAACLHALRNRRTICAFSSSPLLNEKACLHSQHTSMLYTIGCWKQPIDKIDDLGGHHSLAQLTL